MKTSRPPDGTRALGNLKAEMDAAFAMVQTAIAQRAVGRSDAHSVAAECVKKTTLLVNAALADENRTEADKRLLAAKLRALVEAAGRIPAP